MVDKSKMLAQLALHEGVELSPYVDTLGNTTVGIGYNVTARGWDDWDAITGNRDHQGVLRSDCYKVCLADIARVERVLIVHVAFYNDVDPVRQRVLVDLTFNIGLKSLGFVNCLAAIERKDWSTAAMELHKAHWAQQVEPGVDLSADAAKILNEQIRGRADRLARMLLTGQEPNDIPVLAAV